MTGFETYLGNFRVLKRMMAQMDVPCSLLSDPSEVLDTPPTAITGCTPAAPAEEIKTAPDAIDTLLLQPWQLVKSKRWFRRCGTSPPPRWPFRWAAATDALLMTVSQLTGKPIADALTRSAAGWST